MTGAGGRLGPVWCRALLSAGATVVGLDLAEPAGDLELLVDGAQPGQLSVRRADVRDRASLETALDWCLSNAGTPGILVNNAGVDQPPGVTVTQRLEDVPAGAMSDVFDVNVVGAYTAMQVFGAAMAARGKGSIVNIGSLYASVSPDARMYDHIPVDPPFLKPAAYGASKAALVNLTRYFATHWAGRGVRVNCLSPGGVAGGQDPEFIEKFCGRVPMGRLAQSSDLTGPLLFLATDASAYVTGIDLKVDGGFTCW